MSPAEFDTLLKNLKKLPGEFKALVEKRIELFTLEVGERVSGVIAHALYRIFGVVFLSLGLILVLFAAANFVGELLDSEGLGFVIVAAPMLLLGLMFFFRRPRSMVTATSDRMLNQFMKDLSDQISQFDTGNNETQETRRDAGASGVNGPDAERRKKDDSPNNGDKTEEGGETPTSNRQ